MAYYSVNEAVSTLMERHQDVKKAILKAQVRKNTAKSKTKYDFWLEVETALKEMIPKKKGKWD